MIIAEVEIINDLTLETSKELLEVAKSLKNQAKYVVVESVMTFKDMYEGMLNTKQIFNVLKNEEVGNIIPITAMLMNQDLEEGVYSKINVKFFDTEPTISINTQE